MEYNYNFYIRDVGGAETVVVFVGVAVVSNESKNVGSGFCTCVALAGLFTVIGLSSVGNIVSVLWMEVKSSCSRFSVCRVGDGFGLISGVSNGIDFISGFNSDISENIFVSLYSNVILVSFVCGIIGCAMISDFLSKMVEVFLFVSCSDLLSLFSISGKISIGYEDSGDITWILALGELGCWKLTKVDSVVFSLVKGGIFCAFKSSDLGKLWELITCILALGDFTVGWMGLIGVCLAAGFVFELVLQKFGNDRLIFGKNCINPVVIVGSVLGFGWLTFVSVVDAGGTVGVFW